ncbi:FirrV-1-D2 [Feldmannia irregularis virus a]|uniref:FirrV-1-D2 n=1 Tax=Feldmannia irregularis virus a TaxID=231992 RepID=Q6XLW7_9PHYC|nr:FirrV-1-D2 [Feldmannia irregularis virus a]AAR26944.1 FirrV-1-D2 [Feldmannia irregularis virus a]
MPSARFIAKFTANSTATAVSAGAQSVLKRSNFLTSIGKSTSSLKSSSLLDSVLSKGGKNTDLLKKMDPPDDAGSLMTSFQKQANATVDTVDDDVFTRVKKISDDLDDVDPKGVDRLNVPTTTTKGIGDRLYDGLKTVKKYDGTIQMAIIGAYAMNLHLKGEAPWSKTDDVLDDPAGSSVLELGDRLDIEPNVWEVVLKGSSIRNRGTDVWLGAIAAVVVVGFISPIFRKKKSTLY